MKSDSEQKSDERKTEIIFDKKEKTTEYSKKQRRELYKHLDVVCPLHSRLQPNYEGPVEHFSTRLTCPVWGCCTIAAKTEAERKNDSFASN